MSTRFSRLLAPLWARFAHAATAHRRADRGGCVGVFPVFWLGRRRPDSTSAGRRCRARVSRVSVDGLDGGRRLPPSDPRCTAAALSASGSSRRIDSSCSPSARSHSGDRRVHGARHRWARLWYALSKGRRTAGFVIAALCLAWSCLALLVVVPAFSGGESIFYGAYDAVGGSPRGIVENAMRDPTTILRALTGPAIFSTSCCSSCLWPERFSLPRPCSGRLPQLLATSSRDRTDDRSSRSLCGGNPPVPVRRDRGWAWASGAPRLRRVRDARARRSRRRRASSARGREGRGGELGGPRGFAYALAARRAAVRARPGRRGGECDESFRVISVGAEAFFSVAGVEAGRLDRDGHDGSLDTREVRRRFDAPRFDAFMAELAANPKWTKVFEQGPVVVFRRAGS